jgi:5'-nucleotidase
MRPMSTHPPDWTQVHLVLLDMDGTLLDLAFDNFIWREAVPSRYAARRGITLAEARRELEPRFQAVAHTLPWYDTDYWSEVTGVNVAALHEEFRDRIGVLDGTIAFLDAIRASGRPMWITTNAHPDSWRPKLAHTGLAHYFEHIVSSYDLRAPKEDARFWIGLREQHPFDPRQALFCDDSLPVLNSARAFGIGQIVAMHHPDTSAPRKTFEQYYSVARLNELLPIGPRPRAP